MESKTKLRQKAFAEEYIINKGNAYQAAIKAGYSERYARGNSHKLVGISCIQEYMAELTAERDSETTLNMQEALEITASIARGEVQKGITKQYDKVKGEYTKDIEYEFTPTIEERQKSLEHYFRISGAFIEKQEVSVQVNQKFDDIIAQAGKSEGLEDE